MATHIDGDREAPRPVHPTGAGQAGESNDAELTNQAAQAADEALAIRLDKIKQAKNALADGTLGTDSAQLADAIIDRMLEDEK